MRATKTEREPRLLTIKAAAEFLGVSEQTLRRWDQAGKLRARRNPMNGYRLYPRGVIAGLRRRITGGAR